MSFASVTIKDHTTASSPRPHVIYFVDALAYDGKVTRVGKRYSDFLDLHTTLGDNEVLPPKRILVTSFIPSAWADDSLVAERKAGLTTYLNNLLKSSQYGDNTILSSFLSDPADATKALNLEDALPSTLSRKAALEAQAQLAAAAASPIAAAYYPDWSADSWPPENLDYSKFDIIFFAFATPNSSSGISYDSGSTSILKRLVTAAHNSGKGTKVVLSIGGWGGSTYFSQAVSSSANRSTFVNAAKSAVSTYNLDGIDIDWEYPNSEGAGNPHSSSDSANLLTFLTSLRSALGSSKIISAAVTHQPFLGSNGQPLTNVAAYAAQLSYINIMNYDVWGSSSTPGPNAPLGNLCGNSKQPQASAEAAYSQWTAAGFPANKMLLGLPLYGYVSQSTKTTLTDIAVPMMGFDVQRYRERVVGLPTRNAVVCPLVREAYSARGESDSNSEGGSGGEGPKFLEGNHDRSAQRQRAEEGAGGKRVEAKAGNGDLSSYFGQQIAFNQIVALGALTKSSNGTYVQANGYTEGWDDCSDTPFLFNTSRKTVVTYDDTYSLNDKAAYAKQVGMAGTMTWSLDQDDGYTLQNAIRKALGKS